MVKIPKILYIGPGTPNLESIKYYHYEDTSLDIHYTDNDNNIEELLLSFNPDAIVTIGESDNDFPNLYKQPFDVRKKWINLSKVDSETGQKAYFCAIN